MKGKIYFSISADSTPVASHTDQLTIIFRYVLDGGPIERFLESLPLTSHKGKDMADLILEALNKSDIDVINCRGQSYDNASDMSGTYTGMQAEIKRTLQVRRLLAMCCTLAKFSWRVSRLLLY